MLYLTLNLLGKTEVHFQYWRQSGVSVDELCLVGAHVNCGKEIKSSNYVWKFSFKKKNLRDVQEKKWIALQFPFL